MIIAICGQYQIFSHLFENELPSDETERKPVYQYTVYEYPTPNHNQENGRFYPIRRQPQQAQCHQDSFQGELAQLKVVIRVTTSRFVRELNGA